MNFIVEKRGYQILKQHNVIVVKISRKFPEGDIRTLHPEYLTQQLRKITGFTGKIGLPITGIEYSKQIIKSIFFFYFRHSKVYMRCIKLSFHKDKKIKTTINNTENISISYPFCFGSINSA